MSALRLPWGAPQNAPCIRQRRLPLTAGDRHRFPLRVRAPQRELNPYPEVPRASRTITFAEDGTVTAEMLTEDDPRYGPMQGTSRGNWSVEGDRLVLADMTLETKAAEGSTNPFGSVLSSLTTAVANTFLRDQMNSTSDVLKLTRSELIFRTVAEDPPVVACTR